MPSRNSYGAIAGLVFAGVLSTWTPDSPAVPPDIGSAGEGYVSGGVGKEEADELRAQAPDYPLELVFVRAADSREEFVADVHLVIADAGGRAIVDRDGQGPIVLARVPDGAYTITAEHGGEPRIHRVDVAGGRHQKVAFVWP